MTRHDIIFDINYSHYMEKMFCTITSRIDKLISVVLMMLGFAVFAPYSGNFIFGAFIAALSAIQFIYQFGKQSGMAQEQSKKYLELMTEAAKYDDAELLKQLNELQKNDCPVWSIFDSAAHKKATIKLGLDDTSSPLNFFEKSFAFFAGGLPKEQKGTQ
ncbi:hypothetical protein [Yokenella regensburgei]|uniref:hypothetical protein n=1 Tax=Yokenella regensburgei TaxID=158877 RepID=UPI001432D637|nr:hypothetical protein [Yokenella regensburgei]QIU89346.1 hypothetical protein HEC60_08460 [Yokenella regensburgei]